VKIHPLHVDGYRWYSGGGMSRDPADATNVMPAAPLALSVHEFTGYGLNAIVQKDLAGGFEVWRAPGPADPWTRAGGGKVGCSGELALLGVAIAASTVWKIRLFRSV
jgi:hypothetical protein